jgi:hypothetical protein
VDRTYDVLANSAIQGTCNDVPLAVVHNISVNVGFTGG